ncbi:MAG: VWA domain-containing protein [Enhygromyxa sp.]
MKRLLGSNWKRIGLQVGLLAGIGLAFAVGTHEQPAEAGGMPNCPLEGDCTFKKPNIMIIMDYSTSMNTVWDNNLTRWEVTVAAVQQIAAPGGYLSQNTHLGLLRFGHDPDPNNPDTPIPNDNSGLLDGYKLDVPWDDANDDYYPCNGQAVIDALNAVPAPMDGAPGGIGTYTKGALDFTAAEIQQTKDDHPDDQDGNPRAYINIVLTDGVWTGPNGVANPPPDPMYNPAITAGQLWTQQDIPTYVVAVAGDGAALAAANELADAGGTGAAIDGDSPEALEQALQDVINDIIESVVAPECIGGLPRVMILLDASSSMLNVDGVAGGMGETGWDQAREALSGDNSLFDVDAGVGTVEDVSHLGLAVFGHDEPAPGEQKIVVNYGPCMKDNFAWALDPVTSCGDGCNDPWGGPPITWTFQDGTQEPPGFDAPTVSHMPQCTPHPNAPGACTGSGTFTHLGLQLIKNNQVSYHQQALQMGAQYPTTPETIYFNILITDGQYDMYSTDQQVQAELTQMYNAGITTYVIGFGDGVDSNAAITQLSNMADWGSNGTEDYYDANNQADLEAALASIFGQLQFDPCCALNDCSENPEPTTNEPDPVPSTTSTTGDGDGDAEAEGDGDGDAEAEGGDGDGDPTTGDGDGDSGEGDGDGDPTTGDGDGDPTTGDGDGDNGEGDGNTSDDEVGDDADDEAGEGDTGTGDGGGGLVEDDGCNCSTADTDGEKTRGLLGGLLALGLAGLVRRRRRD